MDVHRKLKEALFGMIGSVQFDASGGRGIAPASWPAPPAGPKVRVGYAGGLGPDNVAEVIGVLKQSPGAWIDMETRIRNEQDAFDIGLCRQVCEAVYGRI